MISTEKNIDEIIEILGNTSIFKGLSPELLNKIADKIQMRAFAKDYPLIREGWPGVRLYLIKSGSSRVVIGSGKIGCEFTVSTVKQGECVGEMSLLTGEPCCATVKANDDSLLYFLTKGDFDNIISKEPLIYKHISNILIDRLKKQTIKTMHIKEHEIALNRYLQDIKEYQYSRVVGGARCMREIIKDAEALSKIDSPITIIGESGVGKQLLARKIHSNSIKTGSPVIEITLHKRKKVDGISSA